MTTPDGRGQLPLHTALQNNATLALPSGYDCISVTAAASACHDAHPTKLYGKYLPILLGRCDNYW
eukprot:scaffold9691_cov80-Skeletonema_dohrnii-CCMP3373.AAC.3